MDLIRLDSNPNPKPDEFPSDHKQTQYAAEQVGDEISPEISALRVTFNRFGLGEQRRSNFAVEINWIDVRDFVRQFIEMKHPEAVHLEKILRLAERIEDAGWQTDDGTPEDFWEILPRD